MDVYAIAAIRHDEVDGHVARVRWGRFDPSRRVYLEPPREAGVDAVIGALAAGHTVMTAFEVEGLHFTGAQVRRAVLRNGRHTIVNAGSIGHSGPTLTDLPEF
ncbi:MAG: hypothetical protein HY749_20375 [Gammaproteobacteria bacterium]|nr:hypothetical protein [Gammaproteobacteria bacterium]MBI5618798.1 hypothetical protein [Gammaproteobacteria bacterium]